MPIVKLTAIRPGISKLEAIKCLRYASRSDPGLALAKNICETLPHEIDAAQPEELSRCFVCSCSESVIYNVVLTRCGGNDWLAALSIPAAHVGVEVESYHGWQALMELAERMRKMGLLD